MGVSRQQYSTCSNYSTLFKFENIFNCSIKTEMKITEVEIIWTMRWYSPCARNYSPIRTFIQLNLTFVENFTYLTSNPTVGSIPIEYCSIDSVIYIGVCIGDFLNPWWITTILVGHMEPVHFWVLKNNLGKYF